MHVLWKKYSRNERFYFLNYILKNMIHSPMTKPESKTFDLEKNMRIFQKFLSPEFKV